MYTELNYFEFLECIWGIMESSLYLEQKSVICEHRFRKFSVLGRLTAL